MTEKTNNSANRFRAPSRIPVVAVLLFALLSVSCQTSVFILKGGGRTEATKELPPPVRMRYASVGFGIYDLTKTKENPCDGTPDRIEIGMDWLDVITHVMIGGGYTTRTLSIQCEKLPDPPPAAPEPAGKEPVKQSP